LRGVPNLGLADAYCILQNGLEHRLQLAERRTDDAQYFERGGLLLRLVQFAGEPRNLCFLAGRGRTPTRTAFGTPWRFRLAALRPRNLLSSPPVSRAPSHCLSRG
jgi:hypothetical protein